MRHLSTVILLAYIAVSSALPTIDLTTAPLLERGESLDSELFARGKAKDGHVPHGYKPKIKVPRDGHVPASYKPKIKVPRDGHVPASYKPKIKVPRDGHVPPSYKPTVKIPRDAFDQTLYARVISDLDSRFESDHYSGLVSRGELEVYNPRNFDLEERQFGDHGLGQAIVDVVKTIVAIIKEAVKEDNDVRFLHSISEQLSLTIELQAREKFTKETVVHGRTKFPHFNWLTCHVKHDKKFKGTEGKEWGHSHHEVDIKIGGTIGYVYSYTL